MKIAYSNKRLGRGKRALISLANQIIEEYQAQDFDVTLRQLYYQMVARDMIPNTVNSYQRLGKAINDGRMTGLVDWEAIVDLTRELRGRNHWDSPLAFIDDAATWFHKDLWVDQSTRPEVWVEKDALRNVVHRACTRFDVPYFVCRGYPSVSEMWLAAQRILERTRNDQDTIIIHLGDHDPSGVDMSRDIFDRLDTFLGHEGVDEWLEVKRIALNMDQIQEYDPPPNPTKLTDSRAGKYIQQYGYESWELDALEPNTLITLIQNKIGEVIGDLDQMKVRIKEEIHGQQRIKNTRSLLH